MRIDTGSLKGLNIHVPQSSKTRPTRSRIRQALFNHLYGRLNGSRCLDLFSGSGAFAWEALSRGAEAVTLVDLDGEAMACMEKTARDIRSRGQHGFQIIRSDASTWLQRDPKVYDIIFADPPYDLAVSWVTKNQDRFEPRLAKGGILLIECRSSEQIDLGPGLISEWERTYGETKIYQFARNERDECSICR